MGVLLALAAGLPALLVAAKAHGRQLRLEREREGITEVVFGGRNPPFVVALWRDDRIRFWITFPLAALLLGFGGWWWRGWPLAAVAALLWAPPVGFAYSGLRSWFRTRRAHVPNPDAERASIGWWSLTAALWGLSVALAST